MPQRETYLTYKGLVELEAELERLRSVRRQEVAERIQKAKEIGGTADNAEYEDAKNEQAFLEGRILTLENMIQSAVIIPDKSPGTGIVQVGSRVAVVNQHGKKGQYTIVGHAEADPSIGRISNESPVGKAVLGKRLGDEVEANTPAGTVKLRITEVG